MRTNRFLIHLLFVLAACSCKKIETLPPVPKIEFKSFTTFDTTDILGNKTKGGRLRFYFEDGDGDLGLKGLSFEQTDTTNLFFNLYRKRNGSMELAQEGDPLKPSPYTIPFMDRTGQNKILKGTIDVTFFYLFYNRTDTIMYDFYVRDRANNDSNTASTSEIVLSENKVYTK